MSAYYNEWDPYAAQWLRNLIAAKLIMAGEVDERSIAEVQADDLCGFTRCHFFAGIAGWELALQFAGWPDDRPVWTGSCPCQPFSVAGEGAGFEDKRDLWPTWLKLLCERRPPVVFGEQVAAATLWLDRVFADMEGAEYAVAAAILPACAVDAPHRRDRLWFVADADCPERGAQAKGRRDEPNREDPGREETPGRYQLCDPGIVADADRSNGHWWSGPLQVGRNAIQGKVTPGGDYSRTQWRVKPGLPLLANGVSGRVAKLRAFGNAIVPQVAAEFIAAYLECRP